jgi:hypothetical protein
MKNIFLYTFIVLVCGYFTYTYIESKHRHEQMILKTEDELSLIESKQKSVFEMVDEAMMSKAKKEEKMRLGLDSLEDELKRKMYILRKTQAKLDSTKIEISKNKKYNDSLIELNEKLVKEKYKAEISLVESKIIINNLSETNNLMKVKYDSLECEQKKEPYIMVDTVYVIDTIFYKKEDIKKFKLK